MAMSRAVRATLWGLGALAAVLAMIWLAPGFSSLLLSAFIVAYVVAPAVDFLERLKIPWKPFDGGGVPRAAGVVVVLLGAGLLLATLLLLLVPLLSHQGQRVTERLPQVVDWIERAALPWIQATFNVELPHGRTGLIEELRGVLKNLGSKIAAPVGRFLAKSASGVLGLLGTLANAVLVPVVAFYLARDFHEIWPRIRSLVPRERVEKTDAVISEIDKALSGFVRGQLTVAVLLGVIYAVGLSIVGIEGAVVIGLLAGFLNLVPYLGTTLGVGLALLMALLAFDGWLPVAGVAVVFTVGQLAEGFYITPKVVGDQVGLSSVAVILAILAGGEIFGFAGVLLAVPLAATLKVLLGVALEAYMDSDVYRGSAGQAQKSDGSAG